MQPKAGAGQPGQEDGGFNGRPSYPFRALSGCQNLADGRTQQVSQGGDSVDYEGLLESGTISIDAEIRFRRAQADVQQRQAFPGEFGEMAMMLLPLDTTTTMLRCL